MRGEGSSPKGALRVEKVSKHSAQNAAADGNADSNSDSEGLEVEQTSTSRTTSWMHSLSQSIAALTGSYSPGPRPLSEPQSPQAMQHLPQVSPPPGGAGSSATSSHGVSDGKRHSLLHDLLGQLHAATERQAASDDDEPGASKHARTGRISQSVVHDLSALELPSLQA